MNVSKYNRAKLAKATVKMLIANGLPCSIAIRVMSGALAIADTLGKQWRMLGVGMCDLIVKQALRSFCSNNFPLMGAES